MGVEQLESLKVRPFDINDKNLLSKVRSIEETKTVMMIEEMPVINSPMTRCVFVNFEDSYERYMKDMNKDYILGFFSHSHTDDPFSDEEIEKYRETYSRFFKRVFDDFSHLVFRYDRNPDVKCLMILVKGKYYLLQVCEELGLISPIV